MVEFSNLEIPSFRKGAMLVGSGKCENGAEQQRIISSPDRNNILEMAIAVIKIIPCGQGSYIVAE